MSGFADRLREEREAIGWTQETLCEMLNISRDTLSKWENGTRIPKIDKLLVICQLFNCDADYMIGIIPERTHDIKKMKNKTGLSDDVLKLLEDWNNEAFPQVSRIIEFILLYRLHCVESGNNGNDLIDRLNRFFASQQASLHFYPHTGRIISTESDLKNQYSDIISTDEAALLGINNILMDMKKWYVKEKSRSK